MIWYQYLFLALAVVLYSLSQLHTFGKLIWQTERNKYSFLGTESWMRKYKFVNHRVDVTGLTADLEPKFFGSTTFLVWTTDFYHCAQMLMKWCFAFGFFGITWSALIAWIFFWTGIQYGCFKLFSK